MKYYTHIIISFLLALFFTQEILATEVVGSPKGQFAVSPTGAATYTVSIDVPPGIGGMQPQIGITYNSQSGMGNVGWGCNITGVSAITRGTKDIYHDGTAKGMSYGNDDAYYLDGKRLILVSGTEGAVGCIYHPEGDPYTDVTIMSNGSDIYFEAKSPDGNTAVYGDNTNSKVTFSSSGNHIASWHQHSITNAVGRSIYYIYNNTDLYPCVSSITYYNGDTTKTCTVNFTYTTLGSAAQKFRLMDVEGKVDKRLTEIQCKVGSTSVRTYTFSYDTTSDATAVKFPRLTAINVSDSNGNSLSPITLEWNCLPSYSCSNDGTLSLNASYPSGTQISDRAFFSSDLNGDGISDIIQIASDNISYTNNSYLSFHLSHHDTAGNIVFSPTNSVDVDPSYNVGKMLSQKTSCFGDIDGDGLTDYLLTYFNTEHISNTSSVFIRPFYGSSNTPATLPSDSILGIGLMSVTDEMPPYSITDLNNDGVSEMIVLENSPNNFRKCHLITTDSTRSLSVQSTLLSFSSTPKKVFVSDFNGNGMQDMLVICDDGYKLYWNQNGSSLFPTINLFYHFNDAIGTWVTGTDMKDAAHIDMGDFNGDGLPDLIFNDTNSSIYKFALNNGDGTFSHPANMSIDIFDEDKGDDDEGDDDDGKYILLVNDFDHDGKSDVLLAHSHYEYHGLFHSTTYEYTDIRWYRSTGTSLELLKSVQTHTNEDAWCGHITLGDVNGDGITDIINYGGNITQNSSNAMSLSLRVNMDASSLSTGKVSSFTDGFGNSTQISYASLTLPSVYTKGTGCIYPLVDLAAPLHVVSTVKTPTVATSSPSSLMTETYTYEGLKAHVAGRGLLGFAKTTVANDVMERAVVNETSGWASNDYFVPTRTTTTTYLGSVGSSTQSTTTTTLTVANKNSGTRKNFFAYPSLVTTSDFDNYATTTTCEYDTTKGVPTLEKTVYDSDSTNYKKVAYTYGSTKYGGRWLPTQIVHKQQHPNDAQPFATTQKITYNSTTGLPTQVIDNYGTSLPLTTANTYNSYGNLTSKTVSGQGLNPITTNYAYDSSNRFVTGITTTPASTVTTYTHDLWGNVLTETDATVASNPLTTTNTYDGFGNLLTSTSPEGIVTTYDICWNSGATQKYYVYKTETGKPYHMDYYDADGRVTYSSTENIDGYEVSEQTVYNSKGQVVRKTSKDGDFEVMEDYSYDDRGRITSARKDYMLEGENGFTTSYAYEGRKVTTTDPNGRMSEKTFDAWGLLTKSKEPIGTVNYRYKSCGKPSSAGTSTGTVMMSYDACGNQTTLSDPDAGTTTYTYNAAGEVVSQTDARGITTTHTRDALNRISKTTIGATEINYAYGTSGNAAQRLISQSTGSYGISYGYDQYGHVTSETRNFGSTSYITSYEYDTNGNLSKTTYPGNVQVTYGYNTAGFETSMAVNGSTVWEHQDYDGYNTREKLGSGTSALRRSTTRDDHRLLTSITLQKVSNSSTLHSMTFTHDAATGNLTQRTGMIPGEGELFTYDNIDRLVRYQNNNGHWDKILQYGQDGNVEFKTGIGSFGYPPGGKAHAVGNVTNTNGYVSSAGQSVVYNDLSKTSEIYYAHGNSGHLYLDYGPDGQRWKAELYKSSTQYPDTVRYYVGDMEGYKVGSSETVWFYHIGHGVILRKVGLASNTQPTKYYAFTDHLGSVTRIYNTSGTAVFSAQYDPWGVQTVTTNTIKYNRGYCGHEMLNDFQLINMNGRMYDPYLGRFLSPDNYVQLPTSAQSFNRYSYCLNNPLKYVDPSGELFGIDDLFLLTIAVNAYTSAVTSAFNASMQGRNVFEGALRGLGSSLISSIGSIGVGAYFGHGGSTLLNELLRAGVHGIVGGTASLISGDGFAPGFISGSLSSLGTSAVQALGANSIVGAGVSMGIGALSANLSGGNWMMGAMEGLNSALLNHYGGNHGGGNWLPEVVVYGHQGILSSVHAVLDIAGMIPCIGEFADVANAVMYTIQGDFSNAGISTAAMIPVVGNFATGGRLLKNAGKYSVYVGKNADNIVKYVGITRRSPKVRFGEHLRSKTQKSQLDYKVVKETGNLTLNQARAMEQNLINENGLDNLYNKINSISPKYWGIYGIK